jgi:NAD(P)H-dependent FMN reductase
MMKVAIIVGSTRPGRKGRAVADWVYSIASERNDAEFELVDIDDFGLPLLDEPLPPSMGQYVHDHTKAWAAKIDSCDAFIFVTPEYNHSTCGALKNAIDYLFREWNNKVAGFVGYGSTEGARAVEHLRQVMGEIMIADVRAQVGLSLRTDFENFSTFRPADFKATLVSAMLDQVVAWGGALRTLRRGLSARVPLSGIALSA